MGSIIAIGLLSTLAVMLICFLSSGALALTALQRAGKKATHKETWSYAMLAAVGVQDLHQSAGIVDSSYEDRQTRIKKFFWYAFYIFDTFIFISIVKGIIDYL